MLSLLGTAEDEDRRSRQWAYEINPRRSVRGEYHILIPELRKDEKHF